MNKYCCVVCVLVTEGGMNINGAVRDFCQIAVSAKLVFVHGPGKQIKWLGLCHTLFQPINTSHPEHGREGSNLVGC